MVVSPSTLQLLLNNIFCSAVGNAQKMRKLIQHKTDINTNFNITETSTQEGGEGAGQNGDVNNTLVIDKSHLTLPQASFTEKR